MLVIAFDLPSYVCFLLCSVPYSTAQMQLNQRVRATREVTLQMLASRSRVFYATHAGVKGVNCASCGSEIGCASESKIASTSKTASASSVASASKIASASRIVGASKL